MKIRKGNSKSWLMLTNYDLYKFMWTWSIIANKNPHDNNNKIQISSVEWPVFSDGWSVPSVLWAVPSVKWSVGISSQYYSTFFSSFFLFIIFWWTCFCFLYWYNILQFLFYFLGCMSMETRLNTTLSVSTTVTYITKI